MADWRVPIAFSSSKTRSQGMTKSASTPSHVDESGSSAARPRPSHGPLLAAAPSMLQHELAEASLLSSTASSSSSSLLSRASSNSGSSAPSVSSSASSSAVARSALNTSSPAPVLSPVAMSRSGLNASSPAVLVATTEDLDDEMAELMTIPRLPFEIVDDGVPSLPGNRSPPPPTRPPQAPVAVVHKDHKVARELVGPPSPTAQVSRIDRSLVNTEVPGKGVVKWCSWCFEYAPQSKLEDRWMGRNAHECGNCLNETCHCLMCGEGACRSYGSTADKLCFKCDGTFNKTKVPAAMKMDGRCSWCYQRTSHSLHKGVLLGRDVYFCDGCGKRTVLCKGCSICFARGSDELDEDLCVKCSKSIDDWESVRKSPAPSRPPLFVSLASSDSSAGEEYNREDDESIHGWCSWCVEDTRHELVARSLLTRNTYRCSECEHRTLCCTTCQDGMSRSGLGWDDKLCVSCILKAELLTVNASEAGGGGGRRGSLSGNVKMWDWLNLKEKKDTVFDPARYTHQRVMTLLGLSSPFKERAVAEGMIRPFLILVSMRPSKRNRVSNELGWSCIPSPLFGDAHAESWEIISANNVGLISRFSLVIEKLNPLGTLRLSWIECLERVALLFGKLDPEANIVSKLTQEGCLAESRKPYSQAVQHMEQIVMIRVGRLYHKYLIANNLKPPKGEKATAIMNKIKDATGLSDAYGLTWATSIFFKPKTGVPRFSDALDVFLMSRDDTNTARGVLVCLEVMKQLLRMYIGFSVFVDDWFSLG